MEELLIKILKRCKNSVCIVVNQHRNYGESVEAYLVDRWDCGNMTKDEGIEEVGQDVFSKMVETNTIIDVQAYPDSACGFYQTFHYDLEEALKIIANAVKS